MGPVKAFGKILEGLFQSMLIQFFDSGGCFQVVQGLGHAGGALQDFLLTGLPYLFNARNQFHHSRTAVTACLGNVGCREKGLFVGSHDDGKGPAAASGGHPANGHVDVIQIGPFLPIDFDRDKHVI